jgi:16S rRNA (cytosine1402-N4)-methyltransferase
VSLTRLKMQRASLKWEFDMPSHQPVLLEEVTYWLRPERGGMFIDCTVGLGGHAEAMLAASPETVVIGIDRDLESLELARKRLATFGDRFLGIHADFKDLPELLSRVGAPEVRGVLADLGISSLQLENAERGFSFLFDAPLDMRMDRSGGETAADLVNRLGERELADLIFEYGQEHGARRIARAIVRERGRQKIVTTKQLADIVVRALNIPGRWRIHPATRTFQALRIAVNRELVGLAEFVSDAVSALGRGGRLAIISFHSLEDRIVKRAFRLESGKCLCEPAVPSAGFADAESTSNTTCHRCGARRRVVILTKKPVRPSSEEIKRNLRSRSARLRVCEKI